MIETCKSDICLWVGKKRSVPIEIEGKNVFDDDHMVCNFDINISLAINVSVKYNNKSIETAVFFDPRREVSHEGRYKIMDF